ncbi:TetR/AcrR family transcriptional regulator C-terminal domain-containing protein [uncultured Ruthenibacterium sp.]|uniref:TetR/AcrR family transcriptional regulator C-terminal domain-containing protein n=1 Tax=uncultured Ruthenibacterium sp. TaxID=1905347 RepID=UPI00349EFB69
MTKKSLEAISVGDIAAQSGMSRNAFYYHFQDKYDLVNWIFRTESAGFLAQAPDRENWQGILRALCEYFRENRAFYCNALSYTGQNSLREYLFDTFSGVVQQHLLDVKDQEGAFMDPQDAVFAGEFFAATVVGLLERWCSRGMKEDASRYEDCLARILSGEMLNAYLHSRESGVDK